ncbi:MAG: pre-peptidase C-terminal domain-containing protein [Candidatus Thalassarchaeaceae archaeon]|nr:pre-peptidase C-terminal domain-containing protein [Candidatus Thalassarchaeaceae archaeon]
MTSRSGTAVKSKALILLMILTALSPLVQMPMGQDVAENQEFEPQSLELGERIIAEAGPRAPCPSTQNDGGTSGDAANSTNTTKTFGTDPSSQNVPGCVDANDLMDFYSVTLTAGKDYSVELTVPTGADFDLYLVDSNTTILQASEYNDPLESFIFITNSSNAGTYYVVVSRYSSDGTYSLDMWTNNSSPRPDLTSSGVSGPNTATTGSNVNIGYTIYNNGTAALTSSTPYDIPVILSTDTTYDTTDTILSTLITGPNLGINTSQGYITSVSIPSTLSAGNYYWLVWPDGWGNVTELDEFNNNAWSSSTTAISAPGGGSGDMFEPNENTTTATVVSTLPLSQSNLSIHTSTDDDYFAIPMISGNTYWFNNTHTYANGDLDMELTSSSGITLASGTTSSDDETFSHTAAGNTTAYLYIYGYIGATNSYGLTIEDSTTGSTPAGTPILGVTMPDKFSATADLSNLTTGSNYLLESTLYEYYVDGTSSNTTLTPVSWTAGSTSYSHNYSFSTTNMEGQFAVISFLYQNNAFSDFDFDIFYYEMLEIATTASDSGWMHAQNLTVGQSYSVQWWAYDNVTNSSLGSNTVNFTASSTSWYQNVSWTYPTTGNQHNFEAILIPSTGSSYIGAHYDEFVPSPPAISITTYTNNANATTNSVTTQGTDLVPGNGYMWQVTILDSNNTTVASSSLTNVTATGNTMSFGAWAYNTPSLSGQYCAIADLWTANGTQLTGDLTCFSYIYDADSDGVWDSNDLCPNTPIGSTVDQNGCAASQRDTDGDGYTDDVDDFINDPTQWNDADGDGYGDNASGNYGDDFPLDATQWSDADGDGCGDNPNGTNGDQFPFDPTQCSDQDGDGYGDNPNGTNADAFPTDSTQWSDTDGDGYGDNPNGNYADDFPQDATQWSDSDGDGYGDNPNGNNPDLWPTDPTQWADTDGDGYGDNPSGTSGDQFPNDASQWSDYDGDGYGDNPTGNMPDHFPQDGTQWADADGDGCGDNPDGNNADVWPNDPSQCLDSDGDGYGDNASGTNPDAFPNDGTQWADSDGDGWGDNPSGNNADAFPNEYTQQQDVDGDGYGDNPNGVNPDQCPNSPSGATVDSNGCAASELDDDSDGVANDVDTCPNTPGGEVADAIGCSDSQKDGDMDGISDALDACPGSPQGEAVDGYGCAASQRDTDNDGIKDHLDQCPVTPPGAYVNGYGCADTEWDTDEDGIFDADDICPYTSTSDVADNTGCGAQQRDTDDDGIVDADDICPMTQPGYNADANGCDSTQRDGDGDGVNDSMDTNCPNSPAGESVDNFGCAPSELDDDNDGVSNDLDQCANTMTTWNARADGCSPEQVDTDADSVMDATDACANTPAGESVNNVGCGLSQIDSDNDGVNDAEDAFPDDPTEVADSDGDGVGDVADFYPSDRSRSVDEGGVAMPFWIALVLVVFVGIAGVAVFIMRRSGRGEEEIAGSFSMEAQPAEDIYSMAGIDEQMMSPIPTVSLPTIPAHAATNEHGQTTWADETGVSWCQEPDGTLRRYDAESGTWVSHQ